MNKLLAYTLKSSCDLSLLDSRAEKAIAMVAYMWLLLLPTLMISAIPALSQWVGMNLPLTSAVVVVGCFVVLLIARAFLIYCLTFEQSTLTLLLQTLPPTLIIATLLSAVPTIYYIGGVTGWSSLELWASDWSIITLSAIMITLIVAVNTAATLTAVLSTSFIRSIRLKIGKLK